MLKKHLDLFEINFEIHFVFVYKKTMTNSSRYFAIQSRQNPEIHSWHQSALKVPEAGGKEVRTTHTCHTAVERGCMFGRWRGGGEAMSSDATT